MYLLIELDYSYKAINKNKIKNFRRFGLKQKKTKENKKRKQKKTKKKKTKENKKRKQKKKKKKKTKEENKKRKKQKIFFNRLLCIILLYRTKIRIKL